MESIALPQELKSLSGRITDVDSHEMIPAQEWVKVFGKDAQPIADHFARESESEEVNINTTSIPDYPGDVQEVGRDIVNVKGARAPGAASIPRRIEVMDAMGVKSQLIYSSGMACMTVALYRDADNPDFMPEIKGDRKALTRRWFELHNEWASAQSAISSRLRPVGALFGDTPEELTRRAQSLIRSGIRAVNYVPAGDLPGNRSPAHPDLDPLWSVLAEANCPFTLHIAPEATQRGGWRDAPAFKGFLHHGEFNTDPSFLATVHLPYENFLAMMILGGVFDRHPTLRVGIAEVGAYWVGPLAYRLDLWHKASEKFAKGKSDFTATYRLPEKPSVYLERNVRIAPFSFEDVARYIQHYGLRNVLCFSTDYPHVEGGRDAFSVFYNKLSPLGPQVIEDFFVNNGELMLPN